MSQEWEINGHVDNKPNGCVVEFDHPWRGRVKVTLELELGEWPMALMEDTHALGVMLRWAVEAPLPRGEEGRAA